MVRNCRTRSSSRRSRAGSGPAAAGPGPLRVLFAIGCEAVGQPGRSGLLSGTGCGCWRWTAPAGPSPMVWPTRPPSAAPAKRPWWAARPAPAGRANSCRSTGSSSACSCRVPTGGSPRSALAVRRPGSRDVPLPVAVAAAHLAPWLQRPARMRRPAPPLRAVPEGVRPPRERLPRAQERRTRLHPAQDEEEPQLRPDPTAVHPLPPRAQGTAGSPTGRRGAAWEEHGAVFTRLDGRPLDPRADWEEFKALLTEAGIDDRAACTTEAVTPPARS
ncbi:hypothetical protein SsS58_04549 [Streptomyces scabiei]|uniref:Uncharacterized protein n=1 Tax=Streptomyces scabiei TaxID=1930 RepID=A0A100JR93_STRSC|nr:hypothetical protein SsS58_04549 [Streptomyces scabiei]